MPRYTPVDYDPFAPSGTPVDYDPFTTQGPTAADVNDGGYSQQPLIGGELPYGATTPDQMQAMNAQASQGVSQTGTALSRGIPRSGASGLGGLMEFGTNLTRFANRVNPLSPLMSVEDSLLGKYSPNAVMDRIDSGAEGVRAQVAAERKADKEAGLTTPLSRVGEGVLEGVYQLPEYLAPEARIGRWADSAIKAAPAAANAAEEKYKQLVAAGVDPGHAILGAGAAGVITEAGGIVPLGMGGNLATRAVSALPVGAAQYEAGRRLENAALPSANPALGGAFGVDEDTSVSRPDLVQDYDKEAMATGALSSSILAGTMSHGNALHEGARLADQIIKSADRVAAQAPRTSLPVSEASPPVTPKPAAENPVTEPIQPVARPAMPEAPATPEGQPEAARLAELQATTRKTLKQQSEQELLGKVAEQGPAVYRGDVDAMRAKLEAAGLPKGSVIVENGQPAGLRFGRGMREKIDAVLNEVPHEAPEPQRPPAMAEPQPAPDLSAAPAPAVAERAPDIGRAPDVREAAQPTVTDSNPSRMRGEIGWDERGGRMIRDTASPDGGFDESRQISTGDVVGRTKWLAKAAQDGSESKFWRDRPERISEKEAHAALDKHEKGEPLSPRESRFVDYATQTQRAYDADFEKMTEEHRADLRTMQGHQIAEAKRSLRDNGAEFADGDQAEALSLAQWVDRAHDAGVPAGHIIDATWDGHPAEQVRKLAQLISDKGGRNGNDTGTAPQAGGRGVEAKTEKVIPDDYVPRLNELRAKRATLTPDETTELLNLHEYDRNAGKMGGKPMPGVVNRTAYEEAQAAGKLKPVQVFADADNFKKINDTFTHASGDDALRELGAAYREAFGDGNVAHFGGDEFVPQADSEEAAHIAMKKVQDRMARHELVAKDEQGNVIATQKGVGVSYGVGPTKEAAERGQYTDKDRRKAAGLRTDRADASAPDLGRMGDIAPRAVEGDRPQGGEDRGSAPKLSAGPKTGSGTVESARSAAAKVWGRDAISKLEKRGGLEFTTAADVVARGLGGHTEMGQLRGTDPNTGKSFVTKGFHDPATGKTLIVSDDVSPSEVAGVVSHEVFHANAEKFLGSERMTGLKSAAAKLASRDEAIKAAYDKVPEDTPAAHRDEEALAYLAEDAPNHPLSKRLTDEAKLFLNRMGIPLDWLNANAAAVRKIAALNMRDASEGTALRAPAQDDQQSDPLYSKRQYTPEEKDALAKADKSDTGHGVLSEETLAKVMEKPRAPGESREAYANRITPKDHAEMKQAALSTALQRKVGRGEMRAMWAKTERQLDVAQRSFDKTTKYFDKQKPIENLKSIDEWETGKPVEDPHARLFFEAMDAGFADRIQQIRALSPGALEDVITNYFPHLWEDPTKATKWYQGIMAKRPLQGNKSFLKQRYWGTIKEGIEEGGLKPVSTNPVDLVIAKMTQMDKYIAALEFKKSLEERGWVQKIKAGERMPPGYAMVEDPAFRGQHSFVVKGENGEPDTAGTAHFNHVIPEMIARDINNYLSPSLYRFGAFKVLRTIQNLVMSMRLGWSGFHAGFTTVDNAVMHVDVAARKFLQGDIPGALKTMAQGIASPVLAPYEGGVLGKQWLGKKPVDPHTAAILDALQLGGARRLMSTSDYNQALPKLVRAINQKSASGAAKALLPAIGEASSWLIHHKLVPAQKMAARVLLMKFELDRVAHKLGKERGDFSGIIDVMHPDALKQIAGSVVDAVDNRLGQMAYDNQFWNKTARELAQVGIGAVGWQVGTVRTVTGGLKDIAHLWKPEDLVSPLDKAGKLTGEHMERFGRLSYLLSLALTMGGAGAALQYMLTGQAPNDKKDYFFPKTGRKNPDGSDERVSFPSYWMDHYKIATHPLQTAEHKIHPTIGMMIEALTNKDYYGTQIHDEDAPWYKQAAQIGQYIGKGFLPYTVTGIQEANKSGTSAGQNVAQFFGVAKAPASVSRTPMQAFVYERNAFKRPQTTTVDQAEKYAKRREALTALRAGEDPDYAGLTPTEIKKLKTRAKTDPVVEKVKSLSLTDKMRAYELATPEEREEYHLKKLIRGSYDRAKKDQRASVHDRMQTLFNEQQETTP